MSNRKKLIADMEAIKERLESSREDDLYEMGEEVDAVVASYGFSRDDLMEYWGDVSRPQAAVPKPPAPPLYALNADPTKTYAFRGPVPKWLKEAVAQAGLNPESAEDRMAFRAEHMAVVERP